MQAAIWLAGENEFGTTTQKKTHLVGASCIRLVHSSHYPLFTRLHLVQHAGAFQQLYVTASSAPASCSWYICQYRPRDASSC